MFSECHGYGIQRVATHIRHDVLHNGVTYDLESALQKLGSVTYVSGTLVRTIVLLIGNTIMNTIHRLLWLRTLPLQTKGAVEQ